MDELKEKAKSIRKSIVMMLNKAGSGHTGGSLGMADVFNVLYSKIMKHDPKEPYKKDRDRLILSNGHIAPVWYATLAHSGYFPVEELMTLRQINSRLQGHPHYKSVPGIENSAGPLGQGISVAVGHALSAKLDNLNYKTYCCLGDGELNEGEVWEAFFTINKFNLTNLICFVDRNRIQLSGDTKDIMPIEPLRKKFESFNLNVIEANGHKYAEIISAFEKAKSSGKPTIIIFNTTMGYPVSFMNSAKWHGIAPDDEQAKKAIEEINNGN